METQDIAEIFARLNDLDNRIQELEDAQDE